MKEEDDAENEILPDGGKNTVGCSDVDFKDSNLNIGERQNIDGIK